MGKKVLGGILILFGCIGIIGLVISFFIEREKQGWGGLAGGILIGIIVISIGIKMERGKKEGK